MNKVKIDTKKVEYDGNSIRLIVKDEQALVNKLKEKQQEILEEIEKQQEAKTISMKTYKQITTLLEIIELQSEALDSFKDWSVATESQARVSELLTKLVGAD